MKKVTIEFEVSNEAAKDLKKNDVAGVTIFHAVSSKYDYRVYPHNTSGFRKSGHIIHNPIITIKEK